MSDPTSLPLEELLEPRLPSALGRQDDALAAGGVPAAELAAAREAVAAIGAAAAEPTAPGADLRARLLGTFSRKGRYGIFADRVARLFDLSVEDAAALLARAEEGSAWMPFLVEGVDMIPVTTGPRRSGSIATLVRFRPGATFPEHDHRGEETMFVLEGGFRETAEGGDEVWRGDEIHRSDGTGHALLALEGVPCVAAVVIDGHADFR